MGSENGILIVIYGDLPSISKGQSIIERQSSDDQKVVAQHYAF